MRMLIGPRAHGETLQCTDTILHLVRLHAELYCTSCSPRVSLLALQLSTSKNCNDLSSGNNVGWTQVITCQNKNPTSGIESLRRTSLSDDQEHFHATTRRASRERQSKQETASTTVSFQATIRHGTVAYRICWNLAASSRLNLQTAFLSMAILSLPYSLPA